MENAFRRRIHTEFEVVMRQLSVPRFIWHTPYSWKRVKSMACKDLPPTLEGDAWHLASTSKTVGRKPGFKKALFPGRLVLFYLFQLFFLQLFRTLYFHFFYLWGPFKLY